MYLKASFDGKCSGRQRFLLKASSFKKHNPQIFLLPLQNPMSPCCSPARPLLTQGVQGVGPASRLLASQTLQAHTCAGGTKEMPRWVMAPVLRTALKEGWELCWLAHLKPDKLRSFLICLWWERLDVLIGLFYL